MKREVRMVRHLVKGRIGQMAYVFQLNDFARLRGDLGRRRRRGRLD